MFINNSIFFLAVSLFIAQSNGHAKPSLTQKKDVTVSKHHGTMILENNQLNASGKATYVIEPTGRLSVKGKANAFVLGSYRFDESYDVAPENLLSSQYQSIGNQVPFDKFTLKVIAIDQEKKLSTAFGQNKKGHIVFVFDISKPMVDLHRVSFRSKALPVTLNLRRES